MGVGWLLVCCGQWISSLSPAQIVALPPQVLQLQLLAKGPRSPLRKQAAIKKKSAGRILDGETGSRDVSKLESKKETANFLVGKNRSSPLWMVFQLLN